MNKVAITINGKQILASPGANLLEEAILNGIDIPHLCYDPRLKPFGSCRLCFIELVGQANPIPACSLKIHEGMEINTDTDTVRQMRKTALELLMAEHCGDCVAPCQRACPADIDIQGFISHLSNGETAQAAQLIREKMPLPSICGRVCPRFCEDKCRGHLAGDPVDICGLKRFSGDLWLEQISDHAPQAAKDSGKRVAVVGAGSAGLTAAYYLALKGHQITLYDAGPKLGGMLRYGIPEYRLPKELLDKEIKVITDLCKELRLGEKLGQDFTLEELQKNHDAVFIGVGCQQATELGLENSDLPGIYPGVDFLREVISGKPPQLGRRVAIIGGGNTAMDAARTAVRLGAEEVMVIYRRAREQMPAEPIEIEEAMEEGVKFHFLTNPNAFLGEERITEIECIRMELGAPDSSGRQRPVEIAGSEFKLPVDNVILAIGQKVEDGLVDSLGLPKSKWGTFEACSDTFSTSVPGVYVAGDCVSGAATVVEAVGAGYKAAISIDNLLNGRSQPQTNQFIINREDISKLDPQEFADVKRDERVHGTHLPVQERVGGFNEYALGFTEDQSLKESNRCLECGCKDAEQCTLRNLATEYQVDSEFFGSCEKRYTVNKTHPNIHHDPDKCILCGKCVQICQEVVGVSALGFVNRGYDTVVKPSLDLPLSEVCISCGQCVAACPTGSLTFELPWVKRGPWKIDRIIETTCVQCSTGCALHLHMVGKSIVKATSPLRHPVSEGGLCRKGSLNYDFVYSPDRILAPQVRRAGELEQATWQQALQVSAEQLQKLKAEHGPQSLAVLASPGLTNEEYYLAQKLAMETLGTTNIYSTDASLDMLMADSMDQELTYQDVEKSDFILLLNTDLAENYLILAKKVRQALKKGCQLAVISEQPTDFDHHATLNLLVSKGKLAATLKGLRAHIQSKPISKEEIARALAELKSIVKDPETAIEIFNGYLNAKKPVILAASENLNHEQHQILQDITRLNDKGPGQGMLLMHQGGNIRGQQLLGLGKVDNSQQRRPELLKKIKANEIKALIVIGPDAESAPEIFQKDIFTIAIASNWLAELSSADVVLPAATAIESNGTVINSEGRIQHVKAAFSPPGGKENWEIIASLNQLLGAHSEPQSPEEIFGEFVKLSGWCLNSRGDFFENK